MDVGGPTTASTLLSNGLVDEVRLFVNPVILGAGKPFFPALDDRILLNLLETRTFDSAWSISGTRYHPARPPHRDTDDFPFSWAFHVMATET